MHLSFVQKNSSVIFGWRLQEGKTPLYLAIESFKTDVSDYFVRKGADLHVTTKVQLRELQTIPHIQLLIWFVVR